MPKDSGGFPISEGDKARLNPCIKPHGHAEHISWGGISAVPLRGSFFLINQTGCAPKPCPSAAGSSNTTDAEKNSGLHSANQPLSGHLHPPPMPCNRKGSSEAGAQMADEGRSPKRGLDVWLEQRLVQNPKTQPGRASAASAKGGRSTPSAASCWPCSDQVLWPL